MGDFETDSNSSTVNKDSMQYTLWVFFILACFILNIAFMNFIIAVIQESYEKVMSSVHSN